MITEKQLKTVAEAAKAFNETAIANGIIPQGTLSIYVVDIRECELPVEYSVFVDGHGYKASVSVDGVRFWSTHYPDVVNAFTREVERLNALEARKKRPDAEPVTV